MTLRLTVVGSGTGTPHPTRVASAHWIDAGPVRLLVDCGPGVLHRLAALGLPWPTLTHVALTHFHLDHVSDLVALLFASRWGTLPPRTAPLTLVGPVGVAALLARLADAAWPDAVAPGFPLTVRAVTPGEHLALAEGVRLGVAKVPHTVESVAYSLDAGGRRVVVTGDTGADAAVAAWAAGCDALVTECSLPAAWAIPSHLTPEQAGDLAAAARPRRLVLTHFYPPVERVDIRALVGARWAGEVILAEDGTVVEID